MVPSATLSTVQPLCVHVEEKPGVQGVAGVGLGEKGGGGLVPQGARSFFVPVAKRGLRGHVRSVSSYSFRMLTFQVKSEQVNLKSEHF